MKTCFRETPITRIIHQSLSGAAFTLFLMCLSQHERNGGETFQSCNYCDRCSKMKVGVKRLPPFKFDLLRKEKLKSIE